MAKVLYFTRYYKLNTWEEAPAVEGEARVILSSPEMGTIMKHEYLMSQKLFIPPIIRTEI